MSETRHRRTYQNEPFRVEVRFSDDVTGDPYILEDARMRAVMLVNENGDYDRNGTELELFDVTPTQDIEGWVTGLVPYETMQLCPVGVGLYDMALTFEDQDRARVVGGSLQVLRGIS